MADHNHRYLQHAPSGRSHCVKCVDWIHQGQLRVGTSFVPRGQHDQERVWVTWVHAKCFTQQRAQNLVEHAKREGKDIKHYLVVPPSIHAGGSGPESGNVDKFAKFIEARAAGNDSAAQALMEQLESNYHVFPEKSPTSLSDKQAEYATAVMDWSFLDEQLEKDSTIIDHMCKGDLLALCAHQEGQKQTADANVAELKMRVLAYLKGAGDAAKRHAAAVKAENSEDGGGEGKDVVDASTKAVAEAIEEENRTADKEWLNHRFLQHAPSDRSNCGACGGSIPLGQVRVGRPYEPPKALLHAGEHTWVSWEHCKCVSERQAQFLVAHAKSQGKDLAHFFVVPPSVHTGGSGPEKSTVEKFARFVEARAAGDSSVAAAMLEQVEAATHVNPLSPPTKMTEKQIAYAKDPALMDWSSLDRQLTADHDHDVVRHLTKGDLLALTLHQEGRPVGGSVAELRRRITHHLRDSSSSSEAAPAKRTKMGSAASE